jgi:hypothetical protein
MWFLTFGQERKLWVSENKVLSKIFRRKKDEVIEQFMTLRKEESRDLYKSLCILGR